MNQRLRLKINQKKKKVQSEQTDDTENKKEEANTSEPKAETENKPKEEESQSEQTDDTKNKKEEANPSEPKDETENKPKEEESQSEQTDDTKNKKEEANTSEPKAETENKPKEEGSKSEQTEDTKNKEEEENPSEPKAETENKGEVQENTTDKNGDTENNLKEETSEQKDAEVKGTDKKEEGKKSRKKVSFNFDIQEDEVETPGLSVFVDDVIRKLKVNVDDPNRGTIDDVYVNFPSSQVKGEEYVKKYTEVNRSTENYTVDAEDISDADTVDIDKLEGNRSKESRYVKSEKETQDNVPVEKGSDNSETEEDGSVKEDGSNGNGSDKSGTGREELVADLIFADSGSDFEENLVEKWKHLKENTVLKRYFYIFNFFTN